jgi:hypothetical protein
MCSVSRVLEGKFSIQQLCVDDENPWTVIDRATGAIVVVDGQALDFAKLEDAQTWCRLNQPAKATFLRNPAADGQQ